jgi:hypothetical protein
MSASTGTTSSASVYTTPAFWERLWRAAGIQSRPLLHSRVDRLRPSAAGRRIGRRTGRLLRRRSHADSDRGRILRLAVLNPMWFEGALRTPWRMRDKTVGAGRRPPPVPPSERFSSCSSRWSQPSRTPSPAREITCSHRARTTSWAGFVLTLFPRAMLIMAAAFKHGFHKEY